MILFNYISNIISHQILTSMFKKTKYKKIPNNMFHNFLAKTIIVLHKHLWVVWLFFKTLISYSFFVNFSSTFSFQNKDYFLWCQSSWLTSRLSVTIFKFDVNLSHIVLKLSCTSPNMDASTLSLKMLCLMQFSCNSKLSFVFNLSTKSLKNLKFKIQFGLKFKNFQ